MMKYRTIFVLLLLEVNFLNGSEVVSTTTVSLPAGTTDSPSRNGISSIPKALNLSQTEIPTVSEGLLISTNESTNTTPVVASTTMQPTTTTELISNSTLDSVTEHYVTPHARTLEERLTHITCDIPSMPNASRLWMGNQTLDLLLPKEVSYSFVLQIATYFSESRKENTFYHF